MRKVILEQNGWLSGEIAPEYQGRTDLTALRYGAARLDNLVVGAGGALKKRPGTWQFIRTPGVESLRAFVLTRFLVHAENIEAWRRFNAEEIERVIPLHEAVANESRNPASQREKHRLEAIRLRGLLPAAKQLSDDERLLKTYSYALDNHRYSPELARQILTLTHKDQTLPFHEIAYAENRTKGFFRIHNTFVGRTYPVTNADKYGAWNASQFRAATTLQLTLQLGSSSRQPASQCYCVSKHPAPSGQPSHYNQKPSGKCNPSTGTPIKSPK